VPSNAYFLETLDGKALNKALNGKYLKNIIRACGRKLSKEGKERPIKSASQARGQDYKPKRRMT
jgi:hypothetical protein